jgi:hypothetical protein
MAAPTVTRINAEAAGAYTVLETWAETNYTTNGAHATKAFSPPAWARWMVMYLNNDVVAGTSGTVDFKLEVVNPNNFDTAEGVSPLGDWDGITQVTNTTNQQIVIEVGPEVTTDDTGSATASCRYGVRAVLPRWIYYTLTFDSGTEDEDYTGSLAVEFKR